MIVRDLVLTPALEQWIRDAHDDGQEPLDITDLSDPDDREDGGATSILVARADLSELSATEQVEVRALVAAHAVEPLRLKLLVTRDMYATAGKRHAEVRRVLAGERLSATREEDLRRLRELCRAVGTNLLGGLGVELVDALISDGHDLSRLRSALQAELDR